MADKVQEQITKQWVTFANQYGQVAYKDLLDFLDNTRNMYISYGQERSMPGPDGKKHTIDDHTIASLLQGARVCDMVKTYIVNRVDPNVAQPIKKLSNGESNG